MKVEEFLNPNSMLTPGVAGGVIMMITNTVNYQFNLPQKWVALVLSFAIGLLVLMNVVLPIWQRIIYYALNSMIIFSMAAGANTIGRSIPEQNASSGHLQPTISATNSVNQVMAPVRKCSAETVPGAPCG